MNWWRQKSLVVRACNLLLYWRKQCVNLWSDAALDAQLMDLPAAGAAGETCQRGERAPTDPVQSAPHVEEVLEKNGSGRQAEGRHIRSVVSLIFHLIIILRMFLFGWVKESVLVELRAVQRDKRLLMLLFLKKKKTSFMGKKVILKAVLKNMYDWICVHSLNVFI